MNKKNTKKNKQKNSKIFIVILIIISISGFLLYLNYPNKNETTELENEINEEIANDPKNSFEHVVISSNIDMPLDYLKSEYPSMTELEIDKISYFQEQVIHDWFFEYYDFLDTKFYDSFLIEDKEENILDLAQVKKDKILIFRNLDSYKMDSFYDDYAYFIDTTEYIDPYNIYLINYVGDEKTDFLKRYDKSHALLSLKNFENINKDVVMFVDSDNNIVSMVDISRITSMAKFGMYSFNGRFSHKDVIDIYYEIVK